MIEFNPKLTIKQTQAWNFLEDPSVDELLYGGAKYGGKSWFLCVWSYLFSCLFALTHKIPQSDHPLPIGFLGRKVAKNFSDTTLETWFKTIPADGYVAKGNPVELIIDRRVKIDTGGFDNRETVKKFNSAEYAFYAIDQTEETTRDDLSLLRLATFGRLVVNNKPIAGKALYTANPANCWLKEEFIANPGPRRRFVPALPTDNPYCTEKYIDNLKDSLRHRPELLQAYLYGDWDVMEGANQVIKSQWLRLAKDRDSSFWPVVKEYLVCDTARYGDDETVIHRRRNSEITDKVILPYCPTTQISGRLAAMSKKHPVNEPDLPIVVESIGADLGAGVIDELIELDCNVITFNPAGQATDPDKYYNLRAEAWSKTATIMASGILDATHNILFVLQNGYDTLEHQLCTPQYEFRGAKILIEPKEEIKKRLGRSPDHGDCYVIGTWAWDFIEARVDDKGNVVYHDKRRRTNRPESAMVL